VLPLPGAGARTAQPSFESSWEAVEVLPLPPLLEPPAPLPPAPLALLPEPLPPIGWPLEPLVPPAPPPG
jgi:hypothetical protein